MQILSDAGIACDVRPQDVCEDPLEGEHPRAMVERLARLKCESAVAASSQADAGELVVAADTVVWMDGREFGKPQDEQDAQRMLTALSGRVHHVSTGVCIARISAAGSASERFSFVDDTDVEFYSLGQDEIAAYVATGEPMDKAGAYGYQGLGRMLVKRIDGDYYNVVGLPIARLIRTGIVKSAL